MSDLLAASRVDEFIGYGGVVLRENVANKSNIFIECESLLPVLAFAGGEPLIDSLKKSAEELVQRIQTYIGDVRFTDLNQKNYLFSLLN